MVNIMCMFRKDSSDLNLNDLDETPHKKVFYTHSFSKMVFIICFQLNQLNL